MRYPPLHRHDALQPLSREHFNGLRQARQLTSAADSGAQDQLNALEEFGRAWRDEIEAHFNDEERLLGSLAGAEHRARLLREHDELRQLAGECLRGLDSGNAPSPELMRRLGTSLYSHIRWEERELFESVQQSASAEQLMHIAEQTAHIEALRPGSRRRATQSGECGCDHSCTSPESETGEV